MNPRDHQIEGSQWALETIRKHGLAYLSWKERCGKTLTALLTVENSKAKSCLIITKKKAIPGWTDTLNQWHHTTSFEVVNYESAHKVKGNFDFIILDEAHHAISSIGRPSKTWKVVKMHTKGKPILYLSATPYAEHIGLIYHQFKLSDWTPLKQKTFYDFHRQYGIPHKTYTPYGLQETYSKYNTEEVLKVIGHLFDFKTREEVGIEHEPQQNVVVVPLKPETEQLMKDWKKYQVIEVNSEKIFGDSDSKIRTVHYQLEGGTIKVSDNKSIRLYPVPEKVAHIQTHYKEEEIAIMAHFIEERKMLEEMFPKATILSSDGDAEGVDLHHIDKLIIYSMSFKTSKHTQRMARQANHNRDKPIIVDILVCDKPAIGKYVYKTVAVKETNFVKSSYEHVWED